MKRSLIFAIKGYRQVISPLFPPTCRFEPTCSRYAIEAIERFGAVKGSALAAQRIVRCNPFVPGGYDPVPEKSDPKSMERAELDQANLKQPDLNLKQPDLKQVEIEKESEENQG